MSGRQTDLQWAWSQFESTKASPWNLRAAAHLFRRAGFGASGEELNTAVADGLTKSVDMLMDNGFNEPDGFLRESDTLANASIAGGDTRNLSAWWAWRMLRTPAQLLEKTTLFWHGHFATSAAKVEDVELMYGQNQLLRQFALGDFPKMLLEISRDPAMLIYLDSVYNRKSHPNENYAREIMELFCLGEGNYSETDIRELARCFTGWEIKRKKFRFNRYQHDTGEKSVLGTSGKFGGEDGVRIVAGHDAAPHFIAAKLVRYFVMDEPAPSKELIQPLADLLRRNDMQTGPVIRRILTSNLFFSAQSVGRKIKSPVELAIGFLRCLQGSTSAYKVAEATEELGQGLFFPPSVKGWDGGRTWINSATLLGRSNLIRRLLEDDRTRFNRKPLPEYIDDQGIRSASELLDFFDECLFAVPIPKAARERIEPLVKNPRSQEQLITAVHTLCTLPEFQLC